MVRQLGAGHTCDDCHTTVSWLGARFDHTGVTSGCATCHNGATAPGKSVNHIQSNDRCEFCHASGAFVTSWLPHTFRHSTLPYEALDHRANLACTACHQANSQAVAWSAPTYQPNCAGCHANDYRASVDRHNGLSQDQNCANSGCHRISASSF